MNCILYIEDYFSRNVDYLESVFILYEIKTEMEGERGIPECPFIK